MADERATELEMGLEAERAAKRLVDRELLMKVGVAADLMAVFMSWIGYLLNAHKIKFARKLWIAKSTGTLLVFALKPNPCNFSTLGSERRATREATSWMVCGSCFSSQAWNVFLSVMLGTSPNWNPTAFSLCLHMGVLGCLFKLGSEEKRLSITVILEFAESNFGDPEGELNILDPRSVPCTF
ncbi:MAG: hypothetical protein V3V02_02915 [Rhizobiaceae bacterium]